MAVEEIAGWVAPAATMIAAMMTAANLGSRITGYGFIVFTIGSICWSIIGIASGQQNLLLSNGFLTVVNLVGIWRWLGRQAKYEDGSKAAAQRSAHAPVPTLFSAAGLVGAKLLDRDGDTIGSVVDGMLQCDSRDLAYLVVSIGGVGGVGETLRALDPALVSYGAEGVQSKLSAAELEHLPELAADNWPEALPVAA